LFRKKFFLRREKIDRRQLERERERRQRWRERESELIPKYIRLDRNYRFDPSLEIIRMGIIIVMFTDRKNRNRKEQQNNNTKIVFQHKNKTATTRKKLLLNFAPKGRIMKVDFSDGGEKKRFSFH